MAKRKGGKGSFPKRTGDGKGPHHSEPQGHDGRETEHGVKFSHAQDYLKDGHDGIGHPLPSRDSMGAPESGPYKRES